ncbi:radical SAM family heme chaperone HemW [Thioalkalivibrio thiocyanodenitrificans]|uniref:radical SAM family heme chaperone HemW n=1 Tax=Thioalkalivibrio thiocyanodenitrificans TaxID=243063 RepID=UPI0018DB6481|nr:radical SAM family heme chaperone HemW [Thioalkalivibrio thiocyanodenitrificans]
MTPLSLYIHLPWCIRKCPYCDFNSHEVRDEVPEDRYVDALIADLESELPRVWGRRIESVFLGGGTPSLFSPEALDRLFSALRARLPWRPDMEVTLEANPGTTDAQRFRGYREAGVNRLSIGIQSFDDGQLRRLGRIHGANEAREAFAAARSAGFDNINLDLMFGLPEQSVQSALGDLAQALALGPEHLSWYQLTLEPNTRFAAEPPILPEEDTVWDMQETGQGRLAEGGYTQYEVSAYARPDRECRHNLNYWRFGDYLGLGAGAHGKISLPGEERILRRWKLRQPRQYMEAALTGDAASGECTLTREELVFEFVLNATRLTRGVDTKLFTARTGLDPDALEPMRRRAIESGLLHDDSARMAPTATGRRFLNDLQALFLADPRGTP